ncbi:MAG: peptidase M50 [Burkholderiales bacterium RIFCSPLOWO2_12_FULL_61_40]|nr:MAG: peptidase M50 [Burkholderiales bacterium RIFCSPLOWO2_12_FULL_61_40]
MARIIFSQSWHSVAELRPRLIPQARINRHLYRGKVWYVVQDQSGGRYHRLSPGAYALVAGMDGTQTVQSLWERANESSTSDLCTQNEVVDLLVQLHAADLLQADATPDSAALFERFKKKRVQSIKQLLLNPMSLKLPLLDPDGFLNHWMPRLEWCFGVRGLLVWLALVLPALGLAAQHWTELTLNLSDRVLSSSNLLVMAVVFPIVKILHELGHAFATKKWGGTVHEMGLMFLVFAPVPYVDASSSSSFASKHQRAVVAAAGMLVELAIAALAMYVWLLSEPGVVRAVAFNVMLIAGVSTLVVNGNPLLRYDAYFILTDLIEMPNLAQRGPKYLTDLWDRRVFGVQDMEPSAESWSEKRWLLFYTPLAWCYRIFVTISISLFIGSEFFIFGTVLALWGVFTLICMPLWKAYKHVVSSPSLQRRRAQAMRISLSLVSAVLLIAFACPLPLRTRAEGVIWLPEQSILHAGGNGFFQRWLVQPGSQVKRGTPLYLLEDPLLLTELEVSRAKVGEAQAKYRADQFSNPVKAAVSLPQLEQERKVLQRVEERLAKMVGYAEADGVLVAARAQDMPGQYFKKGDLMGYVLEVNQLMARVVVPQDDIDLVRTKFRSADLRLAELTEQAHKVVHAREVSGGVDELPTAALGLSGGGMIPTSPNDPNGLKTIGRVFLVDLYLPPDALPSAFGERVHVRFDHGFEAPALQGLRRLRQLFLSRFSV